MKLYVVQHGEAVPKDIDPGRPLSGRGRDDMKRLAEFLAEARVRVASLAHSGKARAAESAAILAPAIAPEVELQAVDGIAPNDPVDPVVGRLDSLTGDALLVGHLPFMARLVHRLTGGAIAFAPGTAVCLERDQAGLWSIAWVVPPGLLHPD